jgi:hypothetical protein
MIWQHILKGNVINFAQDFKHAIELLGGLQFTKQIQKKIIGKSICENYIFPNDIILIKQMQQNKDVLELANFMI